MLNFGTPFTKRYCTIHDLTVYKITCLTTRCFVQPSFACCCCKSKGPSDFSFWVPTVNFQFVKWNFQNCELISQKDTILNITTHIFSMSRLSLDQAAAMSLLWVPSSTRRTDGGGSSGGPVGAKSYSGHWIFKLCSKHWHSFCKLNDTMLLIL